MAVSDIEVEDNHADGKSSGDEEFDKDEEPEDG